MYAPGKGNDMDKGDWKGLAKALSNEGYNVFRFDWRGHGKSKDIKDTFRFWGLATLSRAFAARRLHHCLPQPLQRG